MVDIAVNTTTTAILDPQFGTFSGQLETAGDVDWIRVDLFASNTYLFYLSLLDTGSVTDGNSFLQVFDSAGNEVGSADDGGVGANSFLSITGLEGTYFIAVSSAD